MSGWMTTNLPWRERFWQDMDAMSFMRLNPHWHIHEKNGAYAIDDILTDFQFCTDAVLERATGLWSARFPTIGLTLMARRGADGNAELAYTFRRDAGCRLNADSRMQAERRQGQKPGELLAAQRTRIFPALCKRFIQKPVLALRHEQDHAQNDPASTAHLLLHIQTDLVGNGSHGHPRHRLPVLLQLKGNS